MFIGAEVQLDLGFEAVQARLATLVRGGLLPRASVGAYDEWQARLNQVEPWVTALGMCPLVQVLVRDMVTHAGCATWTMRWEVTGPGGSLFPALDADIKLTPAGLDVTMLAVYGAYRPPLGVLGVGLDREIMHQAAEGMIRSFTISIRMAIMHLAASPAAKRGGILWHRDPSLGHRDCLHPQPRPAGQADPARARRPGADRGGPHQPGRSASGCSSPRRR